jgi:hypothetical protein
VQIGEYRVWAETAEGEGRVCEEMRVNEMSI